MRVFLLRHAQAHFPQSPGEDPLCDLTGAGAGQIEETARRAGGADFSKITAIEHSPYKRAAESARLFAAAAGITAPLRENPALVPHGNPDAVALDLLDSPCDRLLVGHNPLFETLSNLLLCGKPRDKEKAAKTRRLSILINFQPGALMTLERFGGPSESHLHGYWQLHGFIVPAQPRFLV